MTLLDDAISSLARVRALDGVAEKVSDAVAPVTHRPAVATVVSGTWLGHPLHPVLTDLPIGCWTSAFALDFVAPRSGQRAARFFVGAGVVAALPTAVTGLADWADTVGETRRIGAFHAVLNLTATACFALSWLARRRGHHVRGVLLSSVGSAVATGGAALGGHLVYRTGTGVDTTVFDARPSDWTTATEPLRPLSEGTGMIEAGGHKVLVSPGAAGTWHGIDARCTHRGGPLEEGRIDHGCVTCPWHQSQFRLDDGTIVHGPATAPQPRYDVEDRDGSFTVRAAADGS
jgi:nitrite reductase/ring-hydroxylating ferredoxin subunit/uncharacterized membrane protein